MHSHARERRNERKVSILGCGWVGKALALELENTYTIMASVQSQSSFDALKVKRRVILNQKNNFNSPSFYKTNTLIIAIPPRGAYLENLITIISHIQEPTQLILLSSTSVYTQTEGVITEEDTQNITTPSLMLQAEEELQALYPSLLILRLGGLMGYNRIAGKYTDGKTLVHNAYVNYVHRDDVVAVIKKCIEKDIRATTYNVVAPIGATKKEIYDYNSKRYGFKKTNFKSNDIKGKQVSSKKLQKELNYTFLCSSIESISRS